MDARPDRWVRGWHVASADRATQLATIGWEPGRTGSGIYGPASYIALDRQTAAVYADAWFSPGSFLGSSFALAEVEVLIPHDATIEWFTDGSNNGWEVTVPRSEDRHITAVLDRGPEGYRFTTVGVGGNQLAIHDTALCRIEVCSVRVCKTTDEIFDKVAA